MRFAHPFAYIPSRHLLNLTDCEREKILEHLFESEYIKPLSCAISGFRIKEIYFEPIFQRENEHI